MISVPDVFFSHGDLLEYTRPFGESHERTVRGIVMGFTILHRADDQRYESDYSMSVWMYEGSVQLGEPKERERAGVQVVETEIKTDREPELVAYEVGQLISFEPEVVRHGNNPRELTNFDTEIR